MGSLYECLIDSLNIMSALGCHFLCYKGVKGTTASQEGCLTFPGSQAPLEAGVATRGQGRD